MPLQNSIGTNECLIIALNNKQICTARQLHISPYWYSTETTSVSRTVSEILSVIEWRDLETGGRYRSRSLNDRSYTTFYWSASVTIALSCTIFELFDVE